MTTYASTQPVPATSRRPLAAVLGAGAALVLTAVGTFKDASGSQGWREYGITAAVVLVVTALVFWFVVRTANASNAGVRSLVLGIVAVLSLVLFWLGLPPVLAAAAIACALVRREQGARLGAAATTGTALGVAVLVVDVVASIVG
jgi:hypothetical protein